MNTNLAARGDSGNVDAPNLVSTVAFAQMLELSSLGSDEAREARRTGAEVLADYPSSVAPWLRHAPARVNVAELHTQIAEMFEAQHEPATGELWLRAALIRAPDASTATWLGATLEQRRSLSEAYVWYLRAAQQGDPVSAGRLAITAQLGGNNDLAGLLISLGHAATTTSQRAAANALTHTLLKVGSRRRSKLLEECRDDDLLFWVGCVLLVSGHGAVAVECVSDAMARSHRVAALALYDITPAERPAPAEGKLAEVRAITDRLSRAIETEPTGSVIPLAPTREPDTRRDVPDEWIAAAIAGDSHAVGRVLGFIRPLVERYCHARLGGTGRSADDVAQEVCLAVLAALPGYRIKGRPFMAFVYGIASHKMIDARRATVRNRSEPVADVPDRVELADGPESTALRVELSHKMSKLLDMLPDKQREILVLRVVVGLSAEETAEAVGSTPGAVRVIHHRALARLRKSMPEEETV